jgi:predicted dehydrogenase
LLGGEPESVVGAAHIGSSGTDWVFAGMMRFPGDVVALFDCGTALPDRDELEAIGTEGTLFLDDPWHCDDPVIELRRTVVGEGGEEEVEVEEIEVEAADPYRLELEAMSAALGREDAVGQVRAIDALFRSAASGETVAL